MNFSNPNNSKTTSRSFGDISKTVSAFKRGGFMNIAQLLNVGNEFVYVGGSSWAWMVETVSSTTPS